MEKTSMLVKWPKITLVTENLNHGEFLEAMIRSAMNQDYPNLEYVVIDGGSTDNSVEIIRKHEDRIAYWCSEKDKGLFDACNKGFARSDGEIMAFVGSDDMLLPGSLHAIGGIFAQFPEIEWLTTFQPAEWDYQGTLARRPRSGVFAARRSARATTRPVPTPCAVSITNSVLFNRKRLSGGARSGRRPGADFARSTSATPPSSISGRGSASMPSFMPPLTCWPGGDAAQDRPPTAGTTMPRKAPVAGGALPDESLESQPDSPGSRCDGGCRGFPWCGGASAKRSATGAIGSSARNRTKRMEPGKSRSIVSCRENAYSAIRT